MSDVQKERNERRKRTLSIRKPRNLPRRSTDTASDVENAHLGLDTGLVSEVVLVTGDGLVEGLSGVVTAEVERVSPSVLVELSGSL